MCDENNIKVSVNVNVYKDIDALKLIVKALQTQTYNNFELVITEDNDSNEMREYISGIKNLNVKHTFQEDRGVRKPTSVNNGIIVSEGEYLIFIDGDCIPYSTFIEAHVELSEPGFVVSGRRCNLGPKYAKLLRDYKISSLELEKSFIYRYPLIAADAKEGHAESGFYIKPNGFIYNNFLKNRKGTRSIVGCNFSCYKSDMVKINGLDEGYDGESGVSDDTDLEWRFKAAGLKLKSARNVANMFHLYHDRNYRDNKLYHIEYENMCENRKNNIFVCKKGLKQH